METGRVSESPLVSVVIPTRGRRPGFLTEAVASVAAQTHDEVELLVVDDSPPEKPVRETVIGPEGSVDPDAFTRVRWLTDGDHNGAGAARNTGIRAATGEFVAFLDDDDAWAETKLDRQLAVFAERGPAVGMVYCGQQYVDSEGRHLGIDRPEVRGDVLEDIVLGQPPEPFSTAVVRAEVPERAGLIDEALPVREDQEWYLRIAKEYEIDFVDAPLTFRRVGADDHLSADWTALAEQTYPRFLDKHRPFVAEMGPLYERRFVAWLSRSVGAIGVKRGHSGAARRFLLRSIRAYPLDPMAYAYLLLSFGGRRTFKSAQLVRRSVGRLVRAVR